MGDIRIFENSAFGAVRVVERSGEPWFVAKDVAAALEYSSTNMPTVFQAVPEEWKGSNSIATPGGEQHMLTLSEQGLYFFLARSDKPGALPFQKWLAGDVLPSIRRHGVYATPEALEQMLADPDTMIRTLQALKVEREKRMALQAQAALDRPKALFADAVNTSESSILVGQLAKILRQNGVDIGQNRLFDWLRAHGYLHKSGTQRNMPTQRAIDIGLFQVKERSIQNPDGSVRLTLTTKVTGKGQIYFVNAFLGGQNENQAA